MTLGASDLRRSVAVAGLLGLHFLLHPLLRDLPVAPDLLLGGLFLATLRLRAGVAAALGFALGIAEGALALTGLGEHALVLTLAAYGAARSRDLLFADARLFVAGYLFAATWAARIGLSVLLAGDDLGQLLLRSTAAAAATAVVLAPLEAVLARTEH